MADPPARKAHPTVTRPEWQAARDRLLAEEKAHTRQGDELARKRRELPWLPVEDTMQTAPRGSRSWKTFPATSAGAPPARCRRRLR